MARHWLCYPRKINVLRFLPGHPEVPKHHQEQPCKSQTLLGSLDTLALQDQSSTAFLALKLWPGWLRISKTGPLSTVWEHHHHTPRKTKKENQYSRSNSLETEPSAGPRMLLSPACQKGQETRRRLLPENFKVIFYIISYTKVHSIGVRPTAGKLN